MRILIALTRYTTLLLILLLLCFTAEAKKPNRRAKPVKIKSTFTTDWTNVDSLIYYYQQRKTAGDFVSALRIGDSLMAHPAMQSKINLLTQQKLELLDSLGKKAEVLTALKIWRIALTSTDSLSTYATTLAAGFASCNDYKSAYEVDQFISQTQATEMEKLKFALDSIQKNEVEEKLKREKAIQQAKDIANTSHLFLWVVSALVFILAVVCIILIVKQFKMRQQHEKLGAQMDHTRTQIDKAFEEGDRINLEIRSMKEQVSRIEAEKKQLRQNVADSTSETLPLLRQQLDALAKENTGALPVEKYMAIQNTITRLNKQLRDMT
ncbi:MAG: hypothetical protein ACKVOK_13870 [Flavobacteriales bacterium]